MSGNLFRAYIEPVLAPILAAGDVTALWNASSSIVFMPPEPECSK